MSTISVQKSCFVDIKCPYCGTGYEIEYDEFGPDSVYEKECIDCCNKFTIHSNHVDYYEYKCLKRDNK